MSFTLLQPTFGHRVCFSPIYFLGRAYFDHDLLPSVHWIRPYGVSCETDSFPVLRPYPVHSTWVPLPLILFWTPTFLLLLLLPSLLSSLLFSSPF